MGIWVNYYYRIVGIASDSPARPPHHRSTSTPLQMKTCHIDSKHAIYLLPGSCAHHVPVDSYLTSTNKSAVGASDSARCTTENIKQNKTKQTSESPTPHFLQPSMIHHCLVCPQEGTRQRWNRQGARWRGCLPCLRDYEEKKKERGRKEELFIYRAGGAVIMASWRG